MSTLSFDDTSLLRQLDGLPKDAFDTLDFGAIGIDTQAKVVRYNNTESSLAGLSAELVVGSHLFEVVAPCMNNFMVAQRFADALEANQALDATIDYVLTFRMRPKRVKLRLLAEPDIATRYVLVRPAA
jgi:photoactive yellow protein